MNLRRYSSVSERRKAVEEELHVAFSDTGNFSLDESVASVKNCENMIGATQIPLGIAGPLAVSGQWLVNIICRWRRPKALLSHQLAAVVKLLHSQVAQLYMLKKKVRHVDRYFIRDHLKKVRNFRNG